MHTYTKALYLKTVMVFHTYISENRDLSGCDWKQEKKRNIEMADNIGKFLN